MDRRTDLALFLAVVDLGSFSAAARALGQTPSAVGKRVRQLELRLGADLLVRSTRRMALTEAGRHYTEEARDILARMTALEEDIAEGSGALRGRIAMTAPGALGRLHIAPLLIDFMQVYPGVEVTLTLSDRNLDLVGEGLDLAVRTGRLPDSDLIGRRVGPYRRVVCAAPSYLSVHGEPDSPSALSTHRCLRLMQERAPEDWGLRGGERRAVRLGPGFASNTLEVLHAACLAGRGIACLPVFLCSDDLEDGRLVPLLSAQEDPVSEGSITVLRPVRGNQPLRVRLLIDYLLTVLPARLGDCKGQGGNASVGSW